ncbi:MAG: SusC/RagA family TonB-linked outer membrane protein, partial [Bacteroidales bacterium]|nr:SusC/RagA family TonB-linked outer membrane protein [Bacteroidales bacterium]
MKLSVIMLLCSALSALASNSYSQTKKLNLELKGVSMGQALESIENQSEFYFLYSRKLVDADRLVSINVKNQSIETTLKQLFNGTDVSYVIKDRVIVLTIPGMADNNLAEFFQQQKVTGTVTDVTTGEPIIGANVVIEGTTLGTVTDSEGKFSISITKPDVVILVSFLGYNTERVIFTGQSILEINMVPDITKLDEVVVVGYGTLKKSDLSSAISKVEGNVIHNQPYSSPAAALVGKSPGVHVISNSGAPGSGVTVRIRGASSLSSGGNDPLYIVDGIPTNNILGINPNDIASIEVLKDASSSAIYGSRASNGVILISTKRGVKGKTELDFDMFYGLQRVYKKMPMMNAKEQWEYVQKGITNYNRLNPNNPVQVREQSRLDYEAGYDTDWQNEIFRIAPVQNYSFSASGGAEKVIYSSNIGYFNQQGVVMSNGYQRISGRFTVDYDLTKYLIIGTSISGNYSINDQIPEGDHPRSVVGNLQRKLPYEPVYELDGSYAMREMANVVAVAKEYEGTDYQTAGIGSVYAKFKITKNLEFKTLFSGDFYNTSGDSFFPSNIPGGTNRPSSAFSNRGLTWLNENVLSYSFKVDKVDVKTIAGYSLQESHAFNFNAAASGGPTDIISTMNASVLLEKINSYKTSWGINSLFTRVYINYANRYLASFSIRQDGSSRFGINNQYAIFPAGSIAWRLSEEEFFKNIKAINDLKIRFSIGRTGNQNIGNYVAQGTYLTGA